MDGLASSKGTVDGKKVSHWLLPTLAQAWQLSDGSIKRRMGLWGICRASRTLARAL
jgi:hypothetical protein